MLVDLRVKNFVLIDEMEINFVEGLNVITGETGAGKSIIVGALDMLLGGRASTDVLRKNKETAYIEAVYEPDNIDYINDKLKKLGIEAEDDILLISREINRNGRNKSRINGQLATLTMVKEMSRFLVDIHGQHEHQSLLETNYHIELLDDFAGAEVLNEKNRTQKLYKKYSEIEKELNNFELEESEKARKLDMYKYQINEIDSASLQEGEFAELKNKYKKITNIEKIFEISGKIYNNINGEGYNDIGILDKLGKLLGEMKTIQDFDNELKALGKELNNVFYQLQDISYRFNDYNENINYSDDKLKEIEDRINLINNLKQKYGETESQILTYRDKLIEEKNFLINQEKKVEELKKQKQQIKEKYLIIAKNLSVLRKEKAIKLEKIIKNEFLDLYMKDTELKIKFERKDPSLDGIDDVEFLISTNPGEDFKPLIKIASGGEISRIMLSFKNIISEIDRINTLIFDEIDSGVGGKTAQKMAEKLAMISKNTQIICITHLPQIASMSDNHLLINKIRDKNKAYTVINNLDKKGKKEELARMLGGAKLTSTTLKHAEEMLIMAQNIKNNY